MLGIRQTDRQTDRQEESEREIEEVRKRERRKCVCENEKEEGDPNLVEYLLFKPNSPTAHTESHSLT